MNREFSDVGREHQQAPELQVLSEEYAVLPKETSEPAREYVSIPDEFAETEAKKPDVQQKKQAEARKKAKRKLIRKMAYMVASSVAVVSMAQTLDTTPGEIIEDERVPEVEDAKQNDPYEFEWPKVPGLDGSYGGTRPVEKDEDVGMNEPSNNPPSENKKLPAILGSQLLYIEEYDSYGWGNGYTIPVKSGELWGLVDYAGNIIVEPAYAGYWSAPNEDGYAILYDENGYYIIGRDGNVHSYDDFVYEIMIGEGNIVSRRYIDQHGEFEYTTWVVYEHLDGTEIYRTFYLVDIEEDLYYVPFHDGKAYIYQNNINSRGQLIELYMDTTAKVLDEDTRYYGESSANQGNVTSGIISGNNGGSMRAHHAIAPVKSYADGYFFGTVPGGGGGYYLLNVDTLERSERMVSINTGLMPDVDWETWYQENYSNSFFGTFELPDFSDYQYYDDLTWKHYYDNGSYLAHYKTYGCLEVKLNGELVKDVLFDYFDVKDEGLNTAIAVYDRILFDNFKYLAVLDGEIWKYIDYTGKVVSQDYLDATSFNDDGYAMVIEKEGTAYVIDSNFNKVKEIESVISVANNGELFSLECKSNGNSDMRDGTYVYYHQ